MKRPRDGQPAHRPAPRPAIVVEAPHPATLSDEALLRQCTAGFDRTSGPGGQHRNKVETAVTLTHGPTGVDAHAGERRKQIENKRVALRRLRLRLAREVRVAVHRERHVPSDLWKSRRQGKQLSINPKHKDYPALLAEALDVVAARHGDVAGAAGVLGISMSQLARLVRHDRHAFGRLNDERESRGLPRLK